MPTRVTCDLCGNAYREEEVEIIPLPHLFAYRATVCLDCIRVVAPYDDGEEVGTGIEEPSEDEVSD